MIPSWLTRSGNTLTFQPPATLLPTDGPYGLEFQLEANVPDVKDPSSTQHLVRKLTVRHAVVPTGLYAMTPASETVTATASLDAHPAGTIIPQLVAQVPGTFSRRGTRTDSYPAAAAGNPLLANWLAFYAFNGGVSEHVLNYCDPFTRACLPAGTYNGALLMRFTANDGRTADFEFPVSLTLTP
ncbi:hypothetical protein HHL11_23260 [Ramlibacter sp. G-1-2-2]|uniref:Uncharacterized protein n=1 Tax=Ramlibacter agri TaxID=2728837 RepID=A0A848HDS0_9BURK|nr:hypothetical protein [Ramlibacter agri]NML46683.1 hypothetical protein [Ramlibacter agri]